MNPVTSEGITSDRKNAAGREALARLIAENERDYAWLARKLGGQWSHSHLYRVSTGERPLTRRLAAAIAEVFGVSIEDLLPTRAEVE